MFVSKLSLKRIVSILLIVFILVSIIMPIININVSYAAQTRLQKSISEFPASYQPYLTALSNSHQNWTFTYFDTGLDWNTVIASEVKKIEGQITSKQLNVIENKGGEWICSCCDNSGRWKHVSAKAVAYYMDPRNFLNEDTIFQFEPLTYVSSYQTKAGVEKILEGTFMDDASKITYKDSNLNIQTINKSYADVIMEAASNYNVNPYHLASRIKQEVSKPNRDCSEIVKGGTDGYLGIYNFFNISATEPNPIINGLEFAKATNATYLLPWTTPELAIKGGAKYIAEKYISIGQDSIYLQKFDVVESGGYYNHQYMQNIAAPTAEGKKVYTAYSSIGLTNSTLNFVIPVYRNMPENACPIPSDTLLSVKLSGTEAILEPDVTVNSLKALHPNATVTGANGDLIGTGSKITINGTTYTAIKLGDVNGDGKVNLTDALLIEKNYVGLHTLTNEFLRAGSLVNRTSKITLTDALKIKRHYVELEYIRQ